MPRVWRNCSVAALACLQVACTAPVKPDQPQALPDKRSPGRIVVVGAHFQPNYSFRSNLPAKGDAAAWGAFLGGGRCLEAIAAGPLAGPFLLVCATVASAMAAVGAASASGAPPATTLDAAKAQGQRALRTLALQQGARLAMLRYGRAEGIDVGSLEESGPQNQEDLPSYAAAKNVADTVIEVSVLDVLAEAIEARKRPYVAMSLRARVRILSTRDGKEVDTMLLRVQAGLQTLDEWLGGDDAALRTMFDRAAYTMAEWSLDEMLLIYRPRDVRPQRVPDETEPVPPYALRAIEPPVRTRLLGDPRRMADGQEPARLDSLQPEFRWEAWPRGFDIVPGSGLAQVHEVRYQLRVYGQGGVAYERRGLTEARHRLEKPLEPCRRYRWTVRAYFTLNGTPRATEWMGAYNTVLGMTDPRWVRREGSAPWSAKMPASLIAFFPIVDTPASGGRACPDR